MVTIGVGSIRSGQGAARVKGATRDVYAAIRHARSVALVTGRRVRVVYSNETVDDEPVAKVETFSDKIMDVDADRQVQPYCVEDYKDLPTATAKSAEKIDLVKISSGDSSSSSSQEGETVEEILFAPVNESVVRGMRLKAVKVEEGSVDETEVQKRHRISIFSNVDWLNGSGRKDGSATKDGRKSRETDSGSAAGDRATAADEMTGPLEVFWQTNGAVDPHDVWIYADGQNPEEGLLLRIDRFGAVKVLDGDGREEE